MPQADRVRVGFGGAQTELCILTNPVPNLLGDSRATHISAGDTDAIFVPSYGMIGVSLKKNGVEALRRIDNLIGAAAANRTVGIPLQTFDTRSRAAASRCHLSRSFYVTTKTGCPCMGLCGLI
jgi:hypothetical protein